MFREYGFESVVSDKKKKKIVYVSTKLLLEIVRKLKKIRTKKTMKTFRIFGGFWGQN